MNLVSFGTSQTGHLLFVFTSIQTPFIRNKANKKDTKRCPFCLVSYHNKKQAENFLCLFCLLLLILCSCAQNIVICNYLSVFG